MRTPLALVMALIMVTCTNKKTSLIAQVPRDTSITIREAYTHLALDSTGVVQFIRQETREPDLPIRIINFYNRRNYQYAWFNEQGLTQHGEAFWNLHQMQLDEDHDSSLSALRLHINMQQLLDGDSIKFSKERLRDTELDLTLHFFKYLNTTFTTKIQPEEVQWYIPRRKVNYQAMLDSFLTEKDQGWRPLSQFYYRLHNLAKRYAAIAKSGGWQVLPVQKEPLRRGDSGPIIGQLKKRLIVSGDYTIDTTDVFNSDLEASVKKLQQSFGFAQTGIINTVLINALNVSVEDRLKQMKINLERMRWMPRIEDAVIINIPEYRLHVFEGRSDVLHMNIVVGREVTRTVIFSDQLEYIIFSPYWNVPPSIARNEVVPAIQRDSKYLSRNNMEITGYAQGLPVIRQRPGPGNALGKVKFVFPNQYNIYLHDTPSKSLFDHQKRAFSHGCIRIQKPFELAKYLLRNEPQWTDKKISAAMERDREQMVRLKQAVPVFITYFTCWVDKDGLLHFRQDVYGHDRRMATQLFDRVH